MMAAVKSRCARVALALAHAFAPAISTALRSPIFAAFKTFLLLHLLITHQQHQPHAFPPAATLAALPSSHPLSIIDWLSFANATTYPDFPWEENEVCHPPAVCPAPPLSSRAGRGVCSGRAEHRRRSAACSLVGCVIRMPMTRKQDGITLHFTEKVLCHHTNMALTSCLNALRFWVKRSLCRSRRKQKERGESSVRRI